MLKGFHRRLEQKVDTAFEPRGQLVTVVLPPLHLGHQLQQRLVALQQLVDGVRELAHHKRDLPIVMEPPPPVAQLPLVGLAAARQLLLHQHRQLKAVAQTVGHKRGVLPLLKLKAGPLQLAPPLRHLQQTLRAPHAPERPKRDRLLVKHRPVAGPHHKVRLAPPPQRDAQLQLLLLELGPLAFATPLQLPPAPKRVRGENQPLPLLGAEEPAAVK